MPSIQQAVAARQNMQISAPRSPELASPSISAPLDLPIGGGLPQRGMFPANFVLSSDRSDSSRAFRGQGARSATFPYQTSAPVAQKLTVETITNIIAAAMSASAPITPIVPVPPTPSGSILLSTNSLPNPNQSALDLLSGNGMTLSVDAFGNVNIAGPQFKTNGTANLLQTLQNLIAGSGITITDGGSGNISISAVGTAGAVIQQYNTTVLGGDQTISASTLTPITDAVLTVTFPSSGGPWRVDIRYWMYWTTGATPTVNMYCSDGSTIFADSQLNGATSGANGQCNSGSDISPVTYADNAIVTFQLYAQAQNNFTVRQLPAFVGEPSTLRAIVFSSN